MKHHLSTWASRLVDHLIPVDTFEAALGDLAEEYAVRHHDGSSVRASGWYWGQVARSVPVMMWMDVRRQGSLSTLATAMGAWVVAGIVEALADGAMIAVAGSDAPVRAMPGLLVGLAALALGGYLAALIRPAATRVLAAIILFVVVALMATQGEGLPLWYQLGFLLLGPFVSIAGGTCRRTLPRS